MSTIYTNTSDMSFSSSFPDGPTGEQQKDLSIFFDAVHNGPFGYLFVNEDALAVHFNDKVCELLCIEPAVLRNKSIYDFLLQEEHSRVRALLTNCTESFAEPVRMVKVKCKKNRFRFVTIYIKKLASRESADGLYIMLFLKNDFNPLSASKEENEAFYRAIIETQEAEREFIGKSLHESIAQELYAIRINLQRYMMEYGHEEQIMPIKKMLNDTIFKVQNISNDLVPTVLRDMGFHKAIDDMVFRMTRSDVRFLMKLDKEIGGESKEIQFCAYRVIQELFNNCLKHTDARRISLKVGVSDAFIAITVEDNGQGFSRDIESALQLGTGLRNIRNRIALYAGTMDMVSSSKGSKMQIKLYK
ncbi:sensor histidine kinase [Sphingobacterium paludis]|uniref:histidine kinase n=1 Tax=Sphingobacterium paludis TaxID=1476465 RepID=A0A4R7CYZ4_9SPHI|nr:ATP-binding protein [Sphingobacterium paludis]TDS13122.1 histidine kinase/DNA gyrase B/HSP90-like ATPase [Sphingobacterium paludis]